MKKLVALVLAAVLCFGSAQAITERESIYLEKVSDQYGLDLSVYTYAQLDKLRRMITSILWEKSWASVTVPEGIWEVGVDIPADEWKITVVSGGKASVYYGAKLAAGGMVVQPFSDGYMLNTLDASNSWTTMRMQDGFFFQVIGDDVLFTRYPKGQPAFEW